jgi:hypothetical protein
MMDLMPMIEGCRAIHHGNPSMTRMGVPGVGLGKKGRDFAKIGNAGL